jgi:hypothetical protein
VSCIFVESTDTSASSTDCPLFASTTTPWIEPEMTLISSVYPDRDKEVRVRINTIIEALFHEVFVRLIFIPYEKSNIKLIYSIWQMRIMCQIKKRFLISLIIEDYKVFKRQSSLFAWVL